MVCVFNQFPFYHLMLSISNLLRMVTEVKDLILFSEILSIRLDVANKKIPIRQTSLLLHCNVERHDRHSVFGEALPVCLYLLSERLVVVVCVKFV